MHFPKFTYILHISNFQLEYRVEWWIWCNCTCCFIPTLVHISRAGFLTVDLMLHTVYSLHYRLPNTCSDKTSLAPSAAACILIYIHVLCGILALQLTTAITSNWYSVELW